VTDAGTVRAGFVLVSATVTPPAGAGWYRVTVQVLEELGPRLVGLQASEETSTGATRLILPLAELLLSVAVIVAVSLFMIEVAAEAVKLPVVAPFAINRPEGTVRSALLLPIESTLQPTEAVFSVTVHLLAEPEVKLAGVQLTELGTTGSVRLMVTLPELPARRAVTVAD
jgi:hypothetical protein